MSRTAASYKRSGPRFKPQPRVLVLCEDSKSSKDYLEDASIIFRAHAEVQVAHIGNTDPLGIVKVAVRRTRDFEEVFCVIDRDQHHNFDVALNLANGNAAITVIPSYPSFEFWLLLHFSYTRAPFMPAGALSAADRVVKALRAKEGMEQYAKGSVGQLFAKLQPLLDEACVRGARSLVDAEQDGEDNPSTRMHELIAKLRSLGKPHPV